MRFVISPLVFSLILSPVLAVHPQVLVYRTLVHAQSISAQQATATNIIDDASENFPCPGNMRSFKTFLALNADARALVDIMGIDAVATLFLAKAQEQCLSPPGSHHELVSDAGPGNVGDNFKCNSPYTPVAGGCACMSPYSMCHGTCGLFPTGCPPPTGRALKPRAPLMDSLVDEQNACNPSTTLCNLPGQKGEPSVQCVDTNVSRENCGGCVVLSLFPSGSDAIGSGKNCSAIPNVADVSCQDGKCIVSSCFAGLHPSPDRLGCTPSLLSARNDEHGNLSAALTTSITLSPDLAPAVAAAVDAVSSLLLGASTAINANVVVGSLVDALGSTTLGLLVASDVPSLAASAHALVHLVNLLDSTLSTSLYQLDALGDLTLDSSIVLDAMQDLILWCDNQTSDPLQPLVLTLLPFLHDTTVYINTLDPSASISVVASLPAVVPTPLIRSISAVVELVGQVQASIPVTLSAGPIATLIEPIVLATIALVVPSSNDSLVDAAVQLGAIVAGATASLDANAAVSAEDLVGNLSSILTLTSSLSGCDAVVNVEGEVALTPASSATRGGSDAAPFGHSAPSINHTHHVHSPGSNTALDTLLTLSLRRLIL